MTMIGRRFLGRVTRSEARFEAHSGSGRQDTGPRCASQGRRFARARALAFIGFALFALFAVTGGRLAIAASKTVDLNGDGTAESPVSLSILSTFPVKVQNKITNKAVGQGFTFQWPSAGPGGFSSRLAPGSAGGVGAIWTWQTTQQVYSFTGNACANDLCLTRTQPSDSVRRGPFGVPGRSLIPSGVSITNESLTSSLITFFSPPTELFRFTSTIDQIAPGLFRYRTTLINNTAGNVHVETAPGPYGCGSVCGNGTREGTEICDGTDLNGATCGNFGQDGTLGCAADCRSFDTAGCVPFPCGDFIREGYEVCDGTDTNSVTCESLGGSGGTIHCRPDCTGFNVSSCTGLCGNGAREGSEACDGNDLGGESCADQGGSGSPFSFSSFSSSNVCAAGSCAIAPNGNATTTSGALRLTASTSSQRGSAWFKTLEPVKYGFTTSFQFKFTGASSPPADGIAFVIQNSSLSALGGGGGLMGYDGIPHSLAVEFDTYTNTDFHDPNANHVAVQSCGAAPNDTDHGSCLIGAVNSSLATTLANGNVHSVTITYTPPPVGTLRVVLDSAQVLNVAVDLATLGLGGPSADSAYVGLTAATGAAYENHDILNWTFTPTSTPGGTLACRPGCTFDISQCTNLCGNGVLDPGEQCDDLDIGGSTCAGHGGGGHVSCTQTCQLDYSQCTSEYCGNGAIDAGEQCDGAQLAGQSCVSMGASAGALDCSGSCTFDLTNCTDICGNGQKEGSEHCDGADLGGFTCEDFGSTGILACAPDCSFDLGKCIAEPPPCDTPPAQDILTVENPVIETCRVEAHPAKEVTTQISICGDTIPDGEGTCPDSSPATQGTVNILVPDTDVVIGPVFFSPTAIRVVAPGGGDLAHPGDTVQIFVSLINAGSSPVGHVVGTLSSPPRDLDGDGTQDTIQIVTAEAAYPDGPCFQGFPGGAIDCDATPTLPAACTNVVPFEITLPAGHPKDVTRKFELSLSYTLATQQNPNQRSLLGDPDDFLTATIPVIVGVGGSVCGNGELEDGEECDDSNTDDGDCCSSTCQFEPAGAICPLDNNPCTDDVCDGVSAVCGHPPNTALCEDGNACTLNDQCSGGACQGGPAPDCDDGNPCTDDSCNPATGCVHTNNTGPCSDGNACTTNDQCGGGSCHGGSPLNCDDGNVCTNDSCNPSSGCVRTNNTNSCSDGNACTTNDRCGSGQCVSGAPVVCTPSDQCHVAGVCAPATGLCSNPAKANGTACSDGSTCTVTDTCQAGACVAGSAPLCPAAIVDADTTVKQSSPSSNYGSSIEIEADKGPTSENRALLRFKISGIGSQHITRATLRLFASDSGSTGGRIRLTSCGWSESSVTWNTKPSLGAIIATGGAVRKGQRVEFDVTAAVADHDGTYCVAIDNSTGDVDYYSREAKSARPELVIETSCGCQALRGVVEADASVVSTSPSTNYGLNPLLRVDYSPSMQTFVRVRVSGIGSRTVKSARLRLQISTIQNAESNKGGDIRLVAASQCPTWSETAITYTNRPTSAGSILSSVGSVSREEIVEFDVTTPVKSTRDGLYCFRIDSTSTNEADYNSLQSSAGVLKPELAITLTP